MRKKFLLIGGGSALILLCILFGAFVAGPLLASAHSTNTATTSPTTTTNTYCQQELQDLAQRLNVSVATLEQDQKAAREDILAQKVKDGKLTQAQADAMKQRIEAQQACTGKGHGPARGDHGVLNATLQKYESSLLNQVASGLHLSASQLQSDLQNGQTLNQIAQTQNVSTSQLQTIVVNAVKSVLSQAQKAGDITQSQETSFLQLLQNNPNAVTSWLNHPFHMPRAGKK